MSTMTTSRTDPPVRADGRCASCGGRRGQLPKTSTQRTKDVLRVELDMDPFCSSDCARAWHGTALASAPLKAPPADLDWTHE
jgi:hypothetical protein